MPAVHSTIGATRMMSISKLTAVLNFFLIAGIVTMAGVAWLAIDTVRIGGPMYATIITGKDLVADIMPPPLFVVEAYQEVTRLESGADDLDERIEKLKRLEAEYVARHQFWTASDYPEEIKKQLTVDSDQAVRRFWREIDTDFVPALLARDRIKARAAFLRITAAYEEHRHIVDAVVQSANAVSHRVEADAARGTKQFLALVIAVTVSVVMFAVFALRRIQSRVTEPLITLARYMEGVQEGELEKDVPFVAQGDEVGKVAQAVASFRAHVEERVLEGKNAQLDAALNNIVQGLEMFDAHGRLVLCNDRYRHIYKLDERQTQPGMTLSDLVALRVASGLISTEMGESIIRSVDRGLADPSARQFQCQLADDRSVDIAVQPMRNGMGFVATHQDVTEQRRAAAKIAYFAYHDVVTGLPNRMSLNEQLEKALAYVRRGELVAVHALDLDQFKSVNDALGHSAGDRLLKIVAERLRSQLREQDSLCRMGGDEFAIVERQIAEPRDAVALADRLIRVLSEPFDIDGNEVVIGTSIGIAVGPMDGSTAEELLRNADLALYRAKAEGRGTFRFFEASMDAQMQARVAMERDLRRAVDNSEFELHYQPIVNVETNEVSGLEALLRWRHPEKGLVAPDQFIPLAEETRLIVAIGEWVLREACAAAANWPRSLKIAVNLSAVQFRFGDVRKAVADALSRSGLDAGRLDLEITESLLLDGDQKTIATLHALRGLGAEITMDDFGTGYSSLSYLQSFPFDKIKIDKSFIQRIEKDGKSLKIVRAVTTLANGLGMKTTAEGVESVAQFEAIRKEGCTEIQGYLMSRPLRPEDVDAFLQNYLPAESEAVIAAE